MSYKLYDAEIEYIENDGASYINTGVKGSSNVTFDIKMYLPSSSENFWLFGSRIANADRQLALINDITNNNVSWRFSNATTTQAPKLPNGIYTFKNTANANVITFSNRSITCTNSTFTNNLDLYIFALNNNGGFVRSISGLRVYYAKIFESGILVRDLIPVRVGTTGYLFDKVSGQLFGNSGTGDFVLGPDVAPAAYANEIAFLESTGSQYIDTGYVPNSNTVIEASVAGLEVGCSPFGVRWANTPTSDTLGLYFASSSPNMVVYWGRYQNNEFTRVDKPLQKKVGVKIGLTQIDIDGNQYPITRGSISSTYSLYLFGMNNMGEAISLFSSRIYNLKIIENNTTLFDFIPVEYNNIGYMYDKVSGEFFANKGTGKFVLGHRAPRFDGKACARSYTRRQLMLEEGRTYIQNGLVFHLDGINKGNDSTAWTDLKGGIKFAYTTHSILQSNGVKFDGAGAISSNSNNTVGWNVGTIEYVFTNRTQGGVLFSGVSDNYFYISVGNGGTCFHPRTNNNQYNYTMPTAAATVSLNNVRGIVNGNNVTKRSTNNWDANPKYMSIGGKLITNYWYVKMVVHSIRIYNRQLSQEEMLYNQRIDNKRFNLGLNI